ncbi:MAG: NAD-dependent epimerase/dehydratase family protein [Kiritimatiellia bacterium]|jgi:nucleoside-diphosphate-sugar epimerase|nr:NAD-dependent epimerase/dehydratase family protein [Kiritimatiellia bacterium]
MVADLKNEKVLVTGGTGFVGCRLVERLFLECKADVRVLVHNWASASWAARLPVDLAQGDVTDYSSVLAAAEGCSVIFHLASGPGAEGDYRATHVDGTRNVLQAARELGTDRVVHVSSVVVHGPDTDGTLTEDYPFIRTGRAYADTKIEAEEIVSSFLEKHGLPVTVLRPTFIWGPRGGQFTLGVIRAMRDGTFALLDQGRAKCPAVYVDNLVDAMLLAAVKDEAVGESFLVADSEDRTWREYFDEYTGMIGMSRLRSIPASAWYVERAAWLIDRLGDIGILLGGNPAPIWRRAIRRAARELLQWLGRRGIPASWHLKIYSRTGGVSIAKARRLLGYQPRVSLSEGMAATEAWLRDQWPQIMELPDAD